MLSSLSTDSVFISLTKVKNKIFRKMFEIEKLTIIDSAPAFTFLLYETLKSEFYQEGLLLGDIIEKETKTITDHDRQQNAISRTIRIDSVLPFPIFSHVYNNNGKINTNELDSLLGNQKSKVISWYKYKPTKNFSLTFREKVIHKQFAEYFNIPKEIFTVCLLISDSTTNYSTHSFQQTFLRCRNNKFEALPFHISNMTDNKNCYKMAEPLSTSFSKIINELKLEPQHDSNKGFHFITKLQQKAEEYMNLYSKHLEMEENELFKLEQKLEQVRNQQNENGIIQN